MSENPLVASGLLLGTHMAEYGHYFENLMSDTNVGFSSSN